MPVLAVRGAEPNPLTPFPVKEGGTEKIWGDNRSWMRRLGTGSGFAGAKPVLNDGEKRRERLVALRDQSFAPGARDTELLAR